MRLKGLFPFFIIVVLVAAWWFFVPRARSQETAQSSVSAAALDTSVALDTTVVQADGSPLMEADLAEMERVTASTVDIASLKVKTGEAVLAKLDEYAKDPTVFQNVAWREKLRATTVQFASAIDKVQSAQGGLNNAHCFAPIYDLERARGGLIFQWLASGDATLYDRVRANYADVMSALHPDRFCK